MAKIRALDEALGGKVRVLAGVETDILADGALDLDDELRSLDWVVGSVHSHLGMPREEMTKRVVRAVESGKIDCLGHATGRCRRHHSGRDPHVRRCAERHGGVRASRDDA